eukprot:9920649-Alexandrium_andersonii.AAC.1
MNVSGSRVAVQIAARAASGPTVDAAGIASGPSAPAASRGLPLTQPAPRRGPPYPRLAAVASRGHH